MEKYCSYCDSKLFENDRNCPNCGAPIRNYVEKTTLITSAKDFDYDDDKPLGLEIIGGDFTLGQGKKKKIDVRCIMRNGSVYKPNTDDLIFDWENEIWIENGEINSKKPLFYRKNSDIRNIKITCMLKKYPEIDGQVIMTLI